MYCMYSRSPCFSPFPDPTHPHLSPRATIRAFVFLVSCVRVSARIVWGAAMKDVVIKAQVLSGGRGRGHFDNGFQSGVHMCLK